MKPILDAAVLDQLFVNARTYSHFKPQEVTDATLKRLYELCRYAPTAANSNPARFVFVKSQTAKEKLKPALSAGNVDKTMAAPVTVIVAYDLEFYEKLPKLFPHVDARAWFAGNDGAIQSTAFRNGSLQGAYLIEAARALGLDCGPMSGFDNAAVDAAFFAGTSWKSNFLINLGYGDDTQLHPRNPRLDFDEACRID
ncbi:malonic semialdehyde reductase [Silvimonas amylolytica]|uniref:Putative NADH dehydrogenase/NAD(P)H nitroreductase GCM10010971_26170 n=1 Tax=Silvimonas amylolytica TaxID=449663 RepID=A0ABQ2PNA0_9NEIS|nr:malonic semialdehyde reductase [Silvimonas amylolytica]GGP26798.1 putative NADH dehydrogenase/NAD(P)H nitroreductase [Silvimonas amylolytica]